MQITPVPVLQDNYAYVITDERSQIAAAVDPVEPRKVLAALDPGTRLTSILTTHHHADHAGGNKELTGLIPQLAVYGFNDQIPCLTDSVEHDLAFTIGMLRITPFHTPCHTRGHVCFFVHDPNTDQKALFSGDTLFIAGCGRFFEGTAQDMAKNMDLLAKLPEETTVWCGHEYTRANLRFAILVEPDNKALAAKYKWACEQPMTIPSTIGEEKQTNPFMRYNHSAVQRFTQKQGVESMQALRAAKDRA
ncbi:hypothetical protein BZG36_02614 [Bifiguratus adelaidae]|uniref:hydroxyacylglutathione hydrolase n=1 Tax=Bifiguratus adelaidae TaxID=1938954 RepID=A0A261Y2L0_9FUNG|nr:hypothetical protein BZG36_02614 [Bifiguratus adelaidae]